MPTGIQQSEEVNTVDEQDERDERAADQASSSDDDWRSWPGIPEIVEVDPEASAQRRGGGRARWVFQLGNERQLNALIARENRGRWFGFDNEKEFRRFLRRLS